MLNMNNINDKQKMMDFTLIKVKEKDSLGVLVLFNINSVPTERYKRYARISVGVDLGEDVIIDAVSK